jgi:hypothetical protein
MRNKLLNSGISHIELNNKIARIIFNRWPEFVTQKEIEFKFAESIYLGEFCLTC